jgi:hypothetical protein
MAKPLELKSPDNANSLFGVYGVWAVIGMAFIVGALTSPGLTLLLSNTWVPVWALVLLLSSLTGLVSAATCSRSSNPVRWLRYEAAGATVLGLCLIVNAVASQLPPGHTLVGLFLYGMIAFATFGRAWQIVGELRRLRIARRKPVIVVHVEALADPHDKG